MSQLPQNQELPTESRAVDSMAVTLDSMPRTSRRRFLQATGLASAGVALGLHPSRIDAALTPTRTSGEEPPGSGKIREIYAEPLTLDEPHKVSLEVLYVNAFNKLKTDVPGFWILNLDVANQEGGGVTSYSKRVSGTFKQRLSGSADGDSLDPTQYRLHQIPVGSADWAGGPLPEFTQPQLEKLREKAPWKLTVGFERQTGQKYVPQSDEGKYTPLYGVKYTGKDLVHIEEPTTKSGEVKNGKPDENKYRAAFRVFGQVTDSGSRYHIPLNGANKDKWWDELVIMFAMAGMRTVIENSAGAPAARATWMGKQSTMDGKDDDIRRVWLVNGVRIVAGGFGSGSLTPTMSVPDSPGDFWMGRGRFLEGGDFDWANGCGNWSFPQADSLEGYKFNQDGWYASNGTTNPALAPGNQPATADSVVGSWDLAKLTIDRITQAAWADPHNGHYRYTQAIPDPHIWRNTLTEQKRTVLLTQGPTFPQNAPPINNRVPQDGKGIVAGPGVICKWEGHNLGADTIKQLVAGFYWNVRNDAPGTELADGAITDHNYTREFTSQHFVQLCGPVDKMKVKEKTQ